jgi:hypothetical protein
VLAPGILPGLWSGDAMTVADVISYFAGGRTVMVPREGYEEPVVIPACPAAAVEAAIAEAVRQGILRLVNGPASFQGEPVPPGVLTAMARLYTPMPPLPVDRLMQDAMPDAWQDGQTSALALSVGLSAQSGHPIPWTVLRRAIDDAIASRWLELAPGSGPWPCDMTGAAMVVLRQPAAVREPLPGEYTPRPKGIYACSAALEPSALQDLIDVLPEVIKTAAGIPLRFHLSVTLGDGQDVRSEIVASINELLEQVIPT